jgi:hypothetical protein
LLLAQSVSVFSELGAVSIFENFWHLEIHISPFEIVRTR